MDLSIGFKDPTTTEAIEFLSAIGENPAEIRGIGCRRAMMVKLSLAEAAEFGDGETLIHDLPFSAMANFREFPEQDGIVLDLFVAGGVRRIEVSFPDRRVFLAVVKAARDADEKAKLLQDLETARARCGEALAQAASNSERASTLLAKLRRVREINEQGGPGSRRAVRAIIDGEI